MTGSSLQVTTTTVLVVDDDADIGLVLTSLFRRAGIATVVARDGAAALRSAAVTALALVVLDLGLPDIDGLDLLPKLRRLTDAPMVLLSARAYDEEPGRPPVRRRRLPHEALQQRRAPRPVPGVVQRVAAR